ncbi:MAG: ArsA family ATPase [Phormidesmis sp. CAN_BIN44]|nr:ArsA family ATPase [Phormidesmis sp. CAN_BIN44]
MKQFDSLNLVMFSGKGGVGKTTLSCGFARRWAKQFPNEKILLLSTDPAHSLGDVLQIEVSNTPHSDQDLSNLSIRALDAEVLLQDFKALYGAVLELLVERGSFVQKGDLSPFWDLSWPGLDELMGILEIQRLLREKVVDRIVVDMAPSGHTLNLFGLMDFLDEFLAALELFQEKHQVISRSFTGRYTSDEADRFLLDMKLDLAAGRQLLQDESQTACLVVAIAEWMSLLETKRFTDALKTLQIPFGGLFINQVLPTTNNLDQYGDQQHLIAKFIDLVESKPALISFQQPSEPVGGVAIDRLMTQIQTPHLESSLIAPQPIRFPEPISTGFSDFIVEGRQLILVGGKGGVGKTTVAAAIAWGMAQQHPDKKIRVISIDPAHSLGDALGTQLEHSPNSITANLSAQEIDAHQVLEQFREDYLWELAEMMSGESNTADSSLKIAYAPEAWQKIVSQALPGIDEMLSLVKVMELLESKEQDLIILDTAPTGHLLRFLEMPTALGDWLAWIFKLWIKYQDVLGRTELMGRLRTLRQRVMQTQKKLQNAQHTEFIGVFQSKSAIIAETKRLSDSLTTLGVSQRYLVNNRCEPENLTSASLFPDQAIVHLTMMPRSSPPSEQIAGAARLLFAGDSPL